LFINYFDLFQSINFTLSWYPSLNKKFNTYNIFQRLYTMKKEKRLQ
jgi:hypothetical protein